MTSPSKPGSLRRRVEDRICKIEGYENIDRLLIKHQDATKADYLLYDREIIVEQKEHEDSLEHNARGKALQDFCKILVEKYNIDPNFTNYSPGILSNQERCKLRALRDKFYDKIKDYMYEADKQIGSIKNLLKISDSRGVLLMIFDQVPGIIPGVIYDRVIRTFNMVSSEGSAYGNIDTCLYVLYMKDMMFDGAPYANGFISRSSNIRHLEQIKEIIKTLTEGEENVGLLTINEEFVVTQNLDRDIF